MPTSVEKQRIYAIVQAVEEAIKEFGPRGVPSGHLYANLMGIMSYHTYQSMIDAMITLKRIKISNHVITWIGDK